VDFGQAELRPDPGRPRGWTLLVDGVPQSYVDLDDPEYLAFDYARVVGRLVRTWSRRRVPGRVLHLGAGALTLARLLGHRFPQVSQVVAERDAALLAFVAARLPYAGDVTVEVGDARDVLERQDPAGYDMIIADVFAGAATPVHIAEKGFAEAAARVLAPGGLYLMNVTDVPPMAWTKVQAATLMAAFADVALVGDTSIVKGRRAGNVVLPAGNVPMINPGKHETVLRGVDLTEFVAGARPRLDASS
jgi:predicted O-methyltransferase YrrM